MKKGQGTIVTMEEKEFNEIVETARECGRKEERIKIMELIKEKYK